MSYAAPATERVARARTLASRSGTSMASKPVARRANAAHRAVAEVSADAQALETNLADSLRPSSAECAKTLVAIADTGTLATTGEDGVALDLRVVRRHQVRSRPQSRDATHTSNVKRASHRCSLYVQPATQPPGVISRATLIGALTKLDDDDAADRMSRRCTTRRTAPVSASTPRGSATSSTRCRSTACFTSAASGATSAPKSSRRTRSRKLSRSPLSKPQAPSSTRPGDQYEVPDPPRIGRLLG